MTSQADRDYYAKRISDERALAKSATDPASARAHADMAEHYERLLSGEPAMQSGNDRSVESDLTA